MGLNPSRYGYQEVGKEDVEMEGTGWGGLQDFGVKAVEDEEEVKVEGAWMGLFASEVKGAKDVFRRDRALVKLYTYWKGRGFRCMVVDRVLHITRCVFTILFTTVLFVVVNWEDLLSCTDDETCEKVQVFKPEPFEGLSTTLSVLVFFESCFAVVVMILIVKFVFFEIWSLLKIQEIYQNVLYITEEELYFGMYDWGTVASKLRAAQRGESRRIATHYYEGPDKQFAPELDELNITQCIMRSENYFISLVNADILKMNSLNTTTVQILKDVIIGWYFELDTKYTLSLRSDKFNARAQRDATHKQREETSQKLKIYIVLGSILLLLGAPLALTWRVAYKSFRYGLLMKSEPGKLVMRTWSVEALWKFREFNELEHVFDMRMFNSRRIAQGYVDKYPHNVERVAAVTASFMLSGLLGFFIMISLLNNTALIHVTINDRSLLWWLSIMSAAFGMLTQLLKEDELRAGLVFEPIQGFKSISDCTHWRPKGWENPADHLQIFKDFKAFYFPWTVWVFFLEGVSVLTTPLQLMFIVLPKVEEIVDHMDACTVRVPGVGDVIAFSTCDFRQFGSKKYGSGGKDGDVAGRCREGKMEKSYLSFHAMQSAEYKCPIEAEKLLDRVKELQQKNANVARHQIDPNLKTIYIDSSQTGTVIIPVKGTGVAEHGTVAGGENVTQTERLTQFFNMAEKLPSREGAGERYEAADYNDRVPSRSGYQAV